MGTGSLVWVLSVLILGDFHEVVTAETAANVAEYRALCRLYSIAIKGQDLEEKVLVPCADGNKCGSSESFVRQLFQRLNFSDQTGVVRALGGEEVPMTNSLNTKMGRAKIQKILLAIETLLHHVEEQLTEAKGHLSNAKLEFRKAVEGEWGDGAADTEVVGFPKTFNANRATDCKLTGGKGGKSLVFDIACLCTNTHATPSNAHVTCGPAIGGDSNGWKTSSGDSTGKAAATTAWKALKADCGGVAEKLTLSPELIEQSLLIFDNLLGKQSGGSHTAAARSVFGKVVTGVACGHGSDVANAGCVDYGDNSGKKGVIEWEKRLTNASQELQKVLENRKRVEALQAKADRLEEKAVAIFNETVLEVQLAGEGKEGSAKATTDSRNVPLQSSESKQDSSLISAASSRRTKSFIFIILVTVIAGS